MNREFVRVSKDGKIDAGKLPDNRETMALDFEGTTTEVYSEDFAARLCQVSFDGEYAFVFNAETQRKYYTELIRTAKELIVHNGSYDLLVCDEHLGIPIEETWPKTVDTQEMGRILYPTSSEALKDLARQDLNVEVDSDKELRAEFKRLKLKPIAMGYRLIPLDNEVFVKYAGLDAIYTWQLREKWRNKFK